MAITADLLIAYRADSGLFNAVADSMHKVFRPSTYSCDLCRLTHGLIGPKQTFKRFLADWPGRVLFLHRDEDLGAYQLQTEDLPCIAAKLAGGGGWRVVITAADIAASADLDSLLASLPAALGKAAPTRQQIEDAT